MFDGLVVRVLAGLLPACASLDDDAAAAMIEHISATQQALALVDHPGSPAGLPRGARAAHRAGRARPRARARHAPAARQRLVDRRPQVEARLGRALSPGTPPAVGAAFVEGFLAGSGTVLVHDADLRAVVDRWLSSLTPQAFDETVPLLRRTFGAFEAAERRQLGVLVAGGARPATPVFGADVDPTPARRGAGHRPPHARPARRDGVEPTVQTRAGRRTDGCRTCCAGLGGRAAAAVAAGARRGRGRRHRASTCTATTSASTPRSARCTTTPRRGARAVAAAAARAGWAAARRAVARWLGDIRRYFPREVVQVMQRDAIDRLDLKQLLLEPELLETIEPDIHLVTLLVELNQLLPDETRATARKVVATVLADLERRLTDRTRAAVHGALARANRVAPAAPGRHRLAAHRARQPAALPAASTAR